MLQALSERIHSVPGRMLRFMGGLLPELRHYLAVEQRVPLSLGAAADSYARTTA